MLSVRSYPIIPFACMLLTASMTAILCNPASANDGGIAMGGTPGLLKGHPSVTMTAEKILVTVNDRPDWQASKVTVDCQFVFTNHGPACTVRMGFPDVGDGAYDPDEDQAPKDVMKTPPQTTFDSFRSYVDGKPVPTKLIRADHEGQYWHSKIVRFPAHSIVHIRDIYTQSVGGGIASIGKKSGFAMQVAYILHTGASWHGPIGRSEVIVTFAGKAALNTLHPVPYRKVGEHSYRDGRGVTDPSVCKPGTVVWIGPCAPVVQGNTLRFVRTNWRPTVRDDIQLTYDYKMEKGSSATAAK